MTKNAYFSLIQNLMPHPNTFKNVSRINKEDIISIDLHMNSIKKISVQFVSDRSCSLLEFIDYLLVFLYSVPGHGSKIKQRMLYASCKESVIDNIEKKFGIPFEKKVTESFPRE